MGRIFEVRKATMFARWDRMAKQFTRIGKEIAKHCLFLHFTAMLQGLNIANNRIWP